MYNYTVFFHRLLVHCRKKKNHTYATALSVAIFVLKLARAILIGQNKPRLLVLGFLLLLLQI